ncbi:MULTISPECIES: ABC transporter substrate-binding protein [unclassified Streptomyces]|uniref:ABC transporter substrate-binding protein n=1 Tax=unclassified Streptomyces TaxID=2593676 RepID=UPI00073B429A|nr:ABC transporter substrate-binding protein [Streptomyces sp. AVP053U2]ODA73187.1 Leu/Ile/Val/Thr-binding protein precursor [Streptomyces sp. AVP053U2]
MLDSIRIAIVGSFTGPETKHSDDLLTGAQQAIKDINARGGVEGKMLDSWKYDDAGEPQTALKADRLVTDHARFVIGHTASALTLTASEYYEDMRSRISTERDPLISTGQAWSPLE